ncbi:glycosyltransferase family 2 protein [Ruminococcaceae bacterium OttesenSCG-928-A11]|nr:glycosyltransferase family 2 protein [Ruminococcaceae bacterium OttesenSCG-928-A11]
MKKLITFVVPCYNSEEYLDRCVESILIGAKENNNCEILLVNDGSSDSTPKLIDAWQKKHPKIIKAIHQKNKGHGGAINTGLKNATGDYFKVVDSDDWLDKKNLSSLLNKLEQLSQKKIDMIVFNYMYDGRKFKSMNYKRSLPVGKIISWDDIGKFGPSNYILMHSIIYRTELLRQAKLELPEHTFYVDNIFVYTILPKVKTFYYDNIDIYHYYIGREDQSVNEKVMTGRFAQQIKITKIMIDATDFNDKSLSEKLKAYMINYLSMMMTISSLFAILAKRQDEKDAIWEYLEKNNNEAYKAVKKTFIGSVTSQKNKFVQKVFVTGYRVARRIWPIN